jgi:RNA polymerase sigma-70 factor (ECF subfamily)
MKSRIATLEDSVLIDLVLAGQAECFAVLKDRHEAAVRKRIRSMLWNTTDEDDLVQEVFLKAWRHLATFRAEASFRTWITRVATNEVAQLHRRNCSSPLCPAYTDLDTFASHCESPYQSLERVEATQTVRNAIAQLPARYRQILILRDLKELSARETARWLKASIPLVKSRLFRARLMLSAAIQRQGQGQGRKRKHPMTNARMTSQIDSISRAA